ncbi:DNA polymerase I [Methylococcus capsulatus]|uniref:DNA polymerase I n=1 Tax=Methylococcus capsulatus TaxID=414 RepID=UPI001C52932B|nr:DNA polymerase I [Methylococcus capsulatus]QXP89033.1 DNA polymerase I [Methylococcus capsulatus]QXP95219.1 DNA polymerase I [Methylococcus capsulatus]UQN11846.1 DNA polymerase I [Methylococcus capsulatus]
MPVSDTSPLLVLVDGSSFLYRAFFALPPLTNSHGEPTGAVYGVINMLRKLLQTYDGAHIAVVFDAPGRNFRDELFEHYKAHRPPMPDDLRSQIEPLHQVVRAMGLPMLIEPGVEADDVIGTLARQAVERGFRVVISTGDKDMAQLVCDRVTLENTMFDSRLDVNGVIVKFGVPPERIVDYLALVGDTSDNIPGVPKVGPKTAAKWLAEYGSLDALIARAGEIGGKTGENLRASLELIPLSRELATIRCDLPLPLTPESLERRPPDKAALRELYTRLEFKTLLRQLDAEADDPKAAPPVAAAPEVQTRYQAVMDPAAFDRWLEKLEAAELFAFDTETSSLDYMRAEVIGLSFAVEPGAAAYVPLAHDYPGAPPQLDRAMVLERLRPLLEDPGKAKLGQHLKYDANVLLNHGIMLRGIRHDTMLESYVLNSTATRHDMDSLAERYLDRKTLHYEDVAGKGAKQIPFARVSVEDACRYAAEDADVTLCLHRALWPRLESIPSLRAVYETIEIPLVPVLSRIERAGVLVDVYKLAEQSRELERRMAEVEAEARAVAGETFNLGSPKQIQTILYDKLGLPVIKKTPTGQPSTDESVLQELAETFELPRLILEYRSLSKLKSTYTDKLPHQVNPVSGRVHTSYHQAVAATGRLSSSDPNLQNIPVRTEEGRRIRQAFVAPPGHKLLAADYSQIELRIMAHLSGDANLLAAFAEDADVHRATAAEVFGVALEEVTSSQRRSAKAINFGLIYGMSAFGLAKQLGIQQKLAQGYIDLYFARYPGVRAYMDRTRESARELGYVETLFGRRLHVPDIQSRNGQRRQYAERTAINAPMQGTAADIIKRAMIALDAWIESSGVPLRMIMQVHDELVFEVAEDFVSEATATVREHMSRAAELAVPLMVDIGTGDNWDEAH